MQFSRQLACFCLMGLMGIGCGSDDDDGGTGNAAGTAGEESGTGGSAGNEGTETGGSAQAGNAGTAGDSAATGGSAGQGGNGADQAGTSGVPESAGSAGTAGEAGSAVTAGTSGSAGSAGSSATAGSAGSTATAGSAGSTATAGSAGDAATAGASGAPVIGPTDAPSSNFAQIEGATFTAGDAPAASSSVDAPDVIAPDAVINGGTATYTVEVPEGATSILVEVEGDNGYYTIPVTSTTGTQQVDVTLLQGFDQEEVEINFATVDADGAVSAWSKETVQVTLTHEGEIKVSLTFDVNEDLDLFVEDPTGEMVYFSNTPSDSNGILDLDSNGGCNINDPIVNSENIYWAEVDALHGEYSVYVWWFAQCNTATTEVNATVTVTLGDEVYTGGATLTPDMTCADAETQTDNCGEDDLVLIGTFTY